jgi:hypothetical protein
MITGTLTTLNDHDDHMTAEEAMESFDTNKSSNLSWDEIWAARTAEDDDHE